MKWKLMIPSYFVNIKNAMKWKISKKKLIGKNSIPAETAF